MVKKVTKAKAVTASDRAKLHDAQETARMLRRTHATYRNVADLARKVRRGYERGQVEVTGLARFLAHDAGYLLVSVNEWADVQRQRDELSQRVTDLSEQLEARAEQVNDGALAAADGR
jgi:DUF917 family protein